MGYALGVSVVVDDRHITVSSRNVLKLQHALSVRDRLMHDTIECDTLHTAITLYNLMISKISRNCKTPIWCTTTTNLTPYIPLWRCTTWWLYQYPETAKPHLQCVTLLMHYTDSSDTLSTAMTFIVQRYDRRISWNCENPLAVCDPTDALQRLISHSAYRYDVLRRDHLETSRNNNSYFQSMTCLSVLSGLRVEGGGGGGGIMCVCSKGWVSVVQQAASRQRVWFWKTACVYVCGRGVEKGGGFEIGRERERERERDFKHKFELCWSGLCLCERGREGHSRMWIIYMWTWLMQCRTK